jgi:hypothetical protein
MIRIDEVWYLSVTTVTLQAIGVVLLLLREFKTRLVFAPLPRASPRAATWRMAREFSSCLLDLREA